MNTALYEEILPSDLASYFEVVSVIKSCNLTTKQEELEIHLDERNSYRKTTNSKHISKGFTPGTRVQDFPLRGKAVYLVIRRRKWLDVNTSKILTNDYSFIAQGAKLTEELAAFLKSTNRYSRRYD